MKYRIKQVDNIFYPQYKKIIFWKNYVNSEKKITSIDSSSIDSVKNFILLKIKEDSIKKYRIKEYGNIFYPQKKELFIWEYWSNIDNYKIHFYSFNEASNFLNQVINEKKIIIYQVNHKQNN